ncbi:retrovirus-related Pol polyprotein from transposon opus [Trichonephila clavipes]|nr:retrovirus-related Pol polyprotein from transposon opus [Trichonephila clavipes]
MVRNRSELETRFYASYQNHNQRPSDFVYELLKIHKQLKLDMVKEKLLDHVISRVEPQLLDYVEVRHPQTTSSLLQIIDKYEERFLNRRIRGSSQEFRDATHSANNQFPNKNRQEDWRHIRVNNRYSDNREAEGIQQIWRSRILLIKLTGVPVLQLPNFQEQFNLFTDASGVGIGAVLHQNHRLIAFVSRTLNKAERNYTVTERECLAVIWALNKFRTYFGTLLVKVITDHAALTKLTNGKNLSSGMIRGVLKLSEFNIELEQRPGSLNVVADVLSRNPVGNVERSQISCAALRAPALNSREQLIQEQREDPELGQCFSNCGARPPGGAR